MQKNSDPNKWIPLPLAAKDALYSIIVFKRVMVIENGDCLAFPDSVIEV